MWRSIASNAAERSNNVRTEALPMSADRRRSRNTETRCLHAVAGTISGPNSVCEVVVVHMFC